MKRCVMLLCLITSFIGSNFAQSDRTASGFIVGKITERTTGQPIESAKISITDGSSVETNASGNFRLEAERGVYSVQISADGFSSVILHQVAVIGGRNTIVNVRLDVTLNENVEVRSQIFSENSEQGVSNVTLGREDLRTTPGTGGDPLRAINSQPAVSAASGEFADLIVRGGTAEENLTYIDNIPVRDFTYFTDQYDGNRGGRASILAPDIFDRAEFSAAVSGRDTVTGCRLRWTLVCARQIAGKLKV